MRDFVRQVDVVTFEFENVAAAVAEVAAQEGVPVRPGGHVLHTTQQRLREKTFLAQAGLPVTPFAAVAVAGGVGGRPGACRHAGHPQDRGLRLRRQGPGAHRRRRTRLRAAWAAIGRQEAILEGFVDFEREVSVVAARGLDGSFAHWGVIENVHRNHILDLSTAPAAVDQRTAQEAVDLARTVLEQLDVVGVLCVEMFVDRRGRLLINELAPRPHNSGHLTIEAAATSQFEQQVRAICGLPLGSTELLRPAAMANLLGDLWDAGEPDWAAALAVPGVKLHLYGKQTPRIGRKMGHLTALAGTMEAARANVLRARTALTGRATGDE